MKTIREIFKEMFGRKTEPAIEEIEEKESEDPVKVEREAQIKAVETMFEKQAKYRYNMTMYPTTTAAEFIAECKRRGIPIYGLEAFTLGFVSIQPSMEHSLCDWGNDENIDWDEAIRFVEKEENKPYLYEIFYEGY